jgi:outer membrane protein
MFALARLTPIAIATAILLAFATAAARAADAPAATMTLPDAVAYAVDHSSTVASQRAAVTQAQHALALQRGIAYPPITAGVSSFLSKSANFQGSFAAIGAAQQNVVSQNTAQVGISNWSLATGGFSFLALASARAQAAQAQNTLANTEDEIAASVTNAFYGIVQRQAVVDVDNATLDAQNALVNVAQARERAGAAAGVDVLQAKTSAAKSQSDLVAARAAVADANEALAQQIGAPLSTQFATPKDVPQPALPKGTLDSLVAVADANRPDVAAAHEAVLAAGYTRRGWNVELFPTVQISALMGNQYSPTNSVALQNQYNVYCAAGVTSACTSVPRGSPGFWSLQAISTFTLPLVDYNARHSERVNDDAQLASAKTTLEQTRLQAELDVRQSYRAALTAQAQLSWAKEEAGYGTESARIAQLQYKAGVKTIYDVLAAEQAAAQALDDYVNARVNYVDAVVKLRVSLGTYDARTAVMDLR